MVDQKIVKFIGILINRVSLDLIGILLILLIAFPNNDSKDNLTPFGKFVVPLVNKIVTIFLTEKSIFTLVDSFFFDAGKFKLIFFKIFESREKKILCYQEIWLNNFHIIFYLVFCNVRWKRYKN